MKSNAHIVQVREYIMPTTEEPNFRKPASDGVECITLSSNVMKFLRELSLVLFRIWLKFKFLINLERKVRYAPSWAKY